MVVKLLGAADLFCVVTIILLQFDLLGWKWAFLVFAYLVIKGWLFRSAASSLIDIMCGVYVLLMMFGLTTWIAYIVALYLFQKAVFSIAA